MTLRDQVEESVDEKIAAMEEDARKCAKNDFEAVANVVKDGNYHNFYKEGRKRVIILISREKINENPVWKKAYKSTIKELLCHDGFKKKEVKVSFVQMAFSMAAVITLKI